MYVQQKRLSSQVELDNSAFTPIQNHIQSRRAKQLFAMKENIPMQSQQNIFKSPKNGLTPYSQQKQQLQIKSNLIKSPNMSSNFRIVSLPFSETKENEIMNRPLPSYLDKYQALALTKQLAQKDDFGSHSSRNISSPHQKHSQATLPNTSSTLQQQQFKMSPLPSSLSIKGLKERSSIFLKTPQNGVQLPQTSQENIKGKTANGFFTQKLKLKNTNKYITSPEDNIKIPSCPLFYDDFETDRSPQTESYTPNKLTTCRRTKFIFKKYMADNEDTQKSSQLLKANKQMNTALPTQGTNFVEESIIQTNNSHEKSIDFTSLKEYYGLKYEPKLGGLHDNRPQQNLKSRKLQIILKQRDNNVIMNNFTTNNFGCEYDMKPWDNKNENTFASEQMDTSLQEILNSLQ